MNEAGSELNQGIAYGEEMDFLDPTELEVGNYLILTTRSGSRYVFKIITKSESGIEIKCFAGPETLFGIEGKMLNNEIYVNGRLFLGEDLTNRSQTGRIKGIIVTEGPPDLSTGPVEYDKEFEMVETASLRKGDFIIVQTDSKSSPIYIFEVVEVYRAIFTNDEEDLEYIQPVFKIHIGKKKHRGKMVKIVSSVLQKGCYLRGLEKLDDSGEFDEKNRFKMRGKIIEIIVTEDPPEVIRKLVEAAVLNEVAEEVEEDGVDVQEEVVEPEPELKPEPEPELKPEPEQFMKFSSLDEKQKLVLLKLGIMDGQDIAKGDLLEAWQIFEEYYYDLDSRESFAEEFSEFLVSFPPTDIALSILYKEIRMIINNISRIYFGVEV